jgi:pimeloyl-ACP methyl ester carboxylesterase
MRVSRGFAGVNGSRLYYESAGTGPPLVLLHGFTLDTRMWDDQFEAFARQYCVIRYDLRGFGRSAVPTGGYSHIEDLRALLAYLRVDAAYIAGLSMGGGVALDYALAYPRVVRGLILIDAVAGGFRWSPEASARTDLIWQEARAGGIAAAKASWLAHPFFAPALRQPAVAARLRQIVADYSGWHFVNTDPERRSTPSAARRLEQISVPTLVMVGELDLPDFKQIAMQLARQIPRAQHALVAGAGHMANMEAPQHVNAAIEQFLHSL